MGKFIQYELWKDCRNHCKFCYNYGQTDKLTKLESLEFFLKKLDEPEVDDYDEIGFIGGEFFDNQLNDEAVQKAFYKLFAKCAEKKQQGKLKKLYIATALMYDINLHLVSFIEYLRILGLSEITMLCTSYDLKYRFRSEFKKKQWEDNMLFLHEKYPEIVLHTEIIMTEFFMQAVINNEFSITDFHNKYNTWIDYVHPQRWASSLTKEKCNAILPDFFAHKDTFLKFLEKTVLERHEINLDTFLAMNVRSDVFYCIYNGKDVDVHNRRKLLESSQEELKEYCKTHENLKQYLEEKSETGFIDSDIQMYDVVKQFKLLHGEA